MIRSSLLHSGTSLREVSPTKKADAAERRATETKNLSSTRSFNDLPV